MFQGLVDAGDAIELEPEINREGWEMMLAQRVLVLEQRIKNKTESKGDHEVEVDRENA